MKKMNVSNITSIAEMVSADWNEELTRPEKATFSTDLETGGSMLITLDNSDVLFLWVSEWGGIEYYRHEGERK